MAGKLSRFVWISFGGLFLMMFLGMAVSAFLGTSPEEVRGIDAINQLMYFRIGLYAFIVAFWAPICSWFTRPSKATYEELDQQEIHMLEQKRKTDTAYLRSLWWKVLLIFVVIEAVLIQQLGM